MTHETATSESTPPTVEPASRLSRRLVLAGLGTAGIAVGTGAATVAGLLDTELADAGITGGSVQLKADYRLTRNGEQVETVPEALPDDADCTTRGLLDGGVLPTFTFENVVPTETGSIDACLYVCENPSYLWVRACAVDDEEVTHTGREVAAGDDTATDGELADALAVTLYLDEDADGERGADDMVLYDGTLAGLDALACSGLRLTSATGVGEATGDGDLTGCTALGKLEEPTGGDFTALEPGADLRDTTSVFTGASVVGNDVYEFTTADGDTVRIELSDPTFNDDDELVEATLTIRTPGVGFCQSATKSAGQPDTVPVVEVQGCPTTITVSSPRPTPETPVADKQQISHVTLWVCPRSGGGGGGTQSAPVCYDPGRYCVGLDWELPADTGVEATTDSVTVDLAFEAVQCRHNMANANPFAESVGAVGGGRR